MAGRACAMGYADFTYHGGALEVARRLAPHAPTPWIDLSTGINPHAYPLPVLSLEDWTRLPERAALAELERVAARRYGAKPESVVAGAGSQALIQALAGLMRVRRVGALGPTYDGHAEAFAAAGVKVETSGSLEAMDELDVAIVVNPNNPDGRITQRADLLDLHARLERRGARLIIDEAFADFDGAEESVAPVLPAKGAVVLRSFSKTFGLGGARLGFAIASTDIVEPLRAALGPWPVSGPAIAIGVRALADSGWTTAMQGRLDDDAARLDALLSRNGWRILGGTRLFRLAEARHARPAFQRLLASGILARPFTDAPERLRFGIPADEVQWRRLESGLG
jgi:cobalamin biosynthesis protein CobC